jgi:Fic family protein
MRSAGYAVADANPFERPPPARLPGGRPESPYVQRLRLTWAGMRGPVIAAFRTPPGPPGDVAALLREVDARYAADAYHSLSIEGYRVSPALIENVRDGRWNPDANARDRATRDAMAARGYFEAHVAVKEDLARILGGANAGAVVRQGLPRWCQALFAPSVQAGILQPGDLAGYRNDQVFIRGARHVPPPGDAVRECMPVLFELLESEPAPQVRAVLGHFLFVYVHPYMDGNGRLGRLLMNLMLAAAGYAWTIIPVERRDEYMRALEQASSLGNVAPFAALAAALERAQARAPLAGPG